LLVDDIECLHPEWQVEYIHAINDLFPTTQVITVTNSSYIWDAHYSWERFLMLSPEDPRRAESFYDSTLDADEYSYTEEV
jgi:predicted ATP-dependent endonuclease of OLD family